MIEDLDTQLWENTPLDPRLNGCVRGYDKVQTLKENDAPLVVPDVSIVRLANQGKTIFGEDDPRIALPGGIAGGQFWVRETLARGIEHLEHTLNEQFGGKYTAIWVEGYRSQETQRAGFTRALQERLAQHQIQQPTHAELLDHGRFAATIFAWVRPDLTGKNYRELMEELLRDSALIKELSDVGPGSSHLEDYITASANSGIGLAANKGVELDSEHNAHAGGGAFDLMIADENGVPLNHIPYPFAHRISAMMYLEDDAHFDEYKRIAETNDQLAAHLKQMGFDSVDDLSFDDWVRLRNANRVRLRLVLSAGGTFYDGETWHFQLGREVKDLNGNVIAAEEITKNHGDSGGVGHTIITQGVNGTAVWGGNSAKQWLSANGLEIER